MGQSVSMNAWDVATNRYSRLTRDQRDGRNSWRNGSHLTIAAAHKHGVWLLAGGRRNRMPAEWLIRAIAKATADLDNGVRMNMHAFRVFQGLFHETTKLGGRYPVAVPASKWAVMRPFAFPDEDDR